MPSQRRGHAAVKISQREQGEREYSMCRSTRGQCKISLTVIHPTNLPPTWNNSRKTCCRLPISSGCFLPESAGLRSDYREKTGPQSAARDGVTALYNRSAGNPLWSLGRGLSICMNVFSDIITNRISKLIEERKEQDIPVSPLLYGDYSLRRLARRRLWVMSWKM